MKILQINTTLNKGSHGRIAEELGLTMITEGHVSYIAAGYTERPSRSKIIKIGNGFDRFLHGLITRLSDRHGFGSKCATLKLIRQIEKINPDIIHLHNIHGYYLHIKILFDYLKKADKPVVWTLHDCWPFTGHCSHFERFNCYKWQKECYSCPNIKGYPASWIIDSSTKNFKDKKQIFSNVKNLQIITPSKWLAIYVKMSFIKDYNVNVINNGIDLDRFKPVDYQNLLEIHNLKREKIILGVANTWKKKKAFDDFMKLSRIINPATHIILIGLNRKMISRLPGNVTGIERTESLESLAKYYSAADIFVNPTYADNFPTTNIEALACGTPVITYNTGGSPESVDEKTGIVVEKGDITGLVQAVNSILEKGKNFYSDNCRKRAERLYNKEDRYSEYLALYNELTNS